MPEATSKGLNMDGTRKLQAMELNYARLYCLCRQIQVLMQIYLRPRRSSCHVGKRQPGAARRFAAVLAAAQDVLMQVPGLDFRFDIQFTV